MRLRSLAPLLALPWLAPLGCGLDLPLVDAPIPTRIEASLTPGDFELEDGSVADAYRLTLAAGDAVTAVVRARGDRALDPYVFLFDGDTHAELAHDDDSAGDLNARILFTAPRGGTFGLVVTTYQTGLHTGEYELETYVGLLPDQR